MNIPCCVDKNNDDGSFCSSKDAKLCDINTDIARTVTCREPGFSVHHSNLCIVRGGQMYRDVNIVAMRGRNPENPKSRKSGIPTEQMLELNPNGTSNALTTVQKDNLVLFQKPLKVGNVSSEHSEGGCVYSDEGVSQTITAGTHGYGMGNILTEYRIRKLTPKECYRLMGVDDKDADKMIAVNSNTQCYKQAGNSIVVDVMAAMFERLF